MIIFNGSCAAREREADDEAIPHVQGQEQCLRLTDQPCGDTQRSRSETPVRGWGTGAAVRRHPMSKGEDPCKMLEGHHV